MKLIYTAGPYRAATPYDVRRNIERARDVAAALWRMGWAVVCPHANSAHLDGVVPEERFLEGDLEMLRRCDALVLIPGWHVSEGSRAEKAEAERHGIPVYVWPHDGAVLAGEVGGRGMSRSYWRIAPTALTPTGRSLRRTSGRWRRRNRRARSTETTGRPTDG
jgi:hypothetical protein